MIEFTKQPPANLRKSNFFHFMIKLFDRNGQSIDIDKTSFMKFIDDAEVSLEVKEWKLCWFLMLKWIIFWSKCFVVAIAAVVVVSNNLCCCCCCFYCQQFAIGILCYYTYLLLYIYSMYWSCNVSCCLGIIDLSYNCYNFTNAILTRLFPIP